MHQNRFSGSKVRAIFLNWWIWPIVGVASEKGLRLQPVQQACFNILDSSQHCTELVTSFNVIDTSLDLAMY